MDNIDGEIIDDLSAKRRDDVIFGHWAFGDRSQRWKHGNLVMLGGLFCKPQSIEQFELFMVLI